MFNRAVLLMSAAIQSTLVGQITYPVVYLHGFLVACSQGPFTFLMSPRSTSTATLTSPTTGPEMVGVRYFMYGLAVRKPTRPESFQARKDRKLTKGCREQSRKYAFIDNHRAPTEMGFHPA